MKEHTPQILPFDKVVVPKGRPSNLNTSIPEYSHLDEVYPMPRPKNLQVPSNPIAIEQTEQKCDRVLFILIGGAGDGWLHQNVKDGLAQQIRSYHHSYLSRIRIVYFQNIKGTGLPSAVINSINGACEKYIVVIGHSWGHDDAIQAVATTDKKVDYLVTLDPVGYSNISKVSLKARNKVKQKWINAWVDISEKLPGNGGNAIAGGGGHRKAIPQAHLNKYLGNIISKKENALYYGQSDADHALANVQYVESASSEIENWLGGIKWKD